ncbi:hypothetical protein SNOUR_03955 [Streptomyces noursei ATCC 11455]|uniref:hypothetical protein n=1 Tax=Streptomyces noursei TaxID=1971 RepID=UPI00081D329B|nr:hypothetical protein SNOUR_03955 [Streptomyces noursei ATCC 11455]
MNRARRTMALAVVTLSTAVVLTACGGSGGASADASRGGSAPAVGTRDLNAHPAADLRQGGTLKMAIQ